MNSVANDPGSLSRLHDIIVAPPVPWWPPQPAWFVLVVLLLLTVGLILAGLGMRWRRNWYRRAGLTELQQIAELHSHDSQALAEVAALLKRVALVAYPRHQVAALTGTEWLQFLDQTGNTRAFTTGPGLQLARIYDRVPALPTPELFQLARTWIRHHQGEPRC